MNTRSISCSIVLLFTIIACRSTPQPAPSAAPVGAATVESSGWYVASQDPLTFCPKGYKLPGVKYGILDGEYVYLADRKSRFFIPTGKDAQRCRKQALVAREASLRDKNWFSRSVASKIAAVGASISSAASRSAHWVGQLGR
ncbi:MAG: hypothetical protein K1X78_22465 [Verrucomicrobiaceae bacterium]|nr:hypothetical protein [Verrucomicrobiaceae bacterium]